MNLLPQVRGATGQRAETKAEDGGRDNTGTGACWEGESRTAVREGRVSDLHELIAVPGAERAREEHCYYQLC